MWCQRRTPSAPRAHASSSRYRAPIRACAVPCRAPACKNTFHRWVTSNRAQDTAACQAKNKRLYWCLRAGMDPEEDTNSSPPVGDPSGGFQGWTAGSGERRRPHSRKPVVPRELLRRHRVVGLCRAVPVHCWGDALASWHRMPLSRWFTRDMCVVSYDGATEPCTVETTIKAAVATGEVSMTPSAPPWGRLSIASSEPLHRASHPLTPNPSITTLQPRGHHPVTGTRAPARLLAAA